jgi:UPF0716 family protein affecting phage T7 exclusion
MNRLNRVVLFLLFCLAAVSGVLVFVAFADEFGALGCVVLGVVIATGACGAIITDFTSGSTRRGRHTQFQGVATNAIISF